MRKWNKILLVVAALGVAAALDACRPRHPEPTYKGHPLSYWVTRYGEYRGNHFVDLGPDPAAAEAISKIGTNALPFLLNWLRYERSEARRWAYSTLYYSLQHAPKSIPSQQLLAWADKPNRRAGFVPAAFKALGPTALPALPAIASIARDPTAPDPARRAQYALRRIGPESVPFLIQVLQDTNALNRDQVTYSIGSFSNPQRKDAIVAALTRHLLDEDIHVRFAVTNELSRIAHEALTYAPPP